MNNEQAALYRGIIANPDDDAPRLIYADWLEEHGHETEADFIRFQIVIAPIGNALCGIDGRYSRWHDLYAGGLRELLSYPRENFHKCVIFRRGFIDEIRLDFMEWKQFGPTIVRNWPITKVELLDKQPRLTGKGQYLFDVSHNLSKSPFQWRPHCIDRDIAEFVPIIPHWSRESALQDLADGALAWARHVANERHKPDDANQIFFYGV